MIKGKKDVEIIIDPRLGAASYQKSEGTSNIISDLQDEDIFASPAEGLPIDDGLQQSTHFWLYFQVEAHWLRQSLKTHLQRQVR